VNEPAPPCHPPGDVPIQPALTNLAPVEGKDQGASGRDPDDEGGEELGSDDLRGWISPDDRLWRHPSESAAPFAGGLPGPEGDAPLNRVRSGAWIIGGATACLVLALVAAGLALVATGTAEQQSSDTTPETATFVGAPTTDPGVGPMAGSAAVAAMVSSIRPSTVALRIHGPTGTSTISGLVAESGGIIVTTDQALTGARSITVIEPDATRQLAQVVGVDPTSGLAVVRIDDDLPPATFDPDDPAVGQVAVATALEPASHGGAMPASVVYAGTVVSAGQALGADTITTDFSSTAVKAPMSHDDLGCALLDSSGHVSGMLEMTRGSGASTMAVFLPSELVLGVARQLVTSGTVEHGWLGIQSSDADATTTSGGTVVTAASAADGARVDSVETGSPAAAAGLAPGDIITGIDGNQVHSTAELRSRLYPDPPGSSLSVTFERGGITLTTSAVLADPDTAAPGDGSSP
jgi:putative serine protease PepD